MRIHRAGEGAGYTGLKSGRDIDPAVLLADHALSSGSPEEMIETLTRAAATGIRERYSRALQSSRRAEESVTAGRQFAADYVTFTHYLEGLQRQIDDAGHDQGAPAHDH